MVWSLSSNNKPPACLAVRSSPTLITITASFAVFTDVFLYAVVVPVIPFTLQSRMNVADEKVQYWVSVSLAVFAVALFVSSPIWGWMADRYQSRRTPMLVGLIWLLAATLLLCFSENIAMLLIARLLQGMSAGMTWSVGLALVIDSVDKNRVGRAIGWTSTALTLGILIGPLVGGIVYGRAGNFAVFGMCFGLVSIDIVLRLAIIEVKDAAKWLVDDKVSTPTADAAVAAENSETTSERKPAAQGVTDPPSQSKEGPSALEEGSKYTLGAKASRAAFSITGRNGIFGLLRKPRVLCALWGTLIQASIQTSFDAILPLEVNDVFYWDSIGGGLIFLPVIIPTFLSPVIGGWSDKYGPRWFTAGGFLFCVPFCVCFRFVTENTISDKVMLCGLLAAVGLGQALQMAPLMAEISWAAEEVPDASADNDNDGGGETAGAPYAQAYALYNIAFSAGAIVGPLLSGMVRESAGFGTVGWSMAILSGFTALVMANWSGGKPLYSFGRGPDKEATAAQVAECGRVVDADTAEG